VGVSSDSCREFGRNHKHEHEHEHAPSSRISISISVSISISISGSDVNAAALRVVPRGHTRPGRSPRIRGDGVGVASTD
jgi:hypothetical protein